MLKLCQNVTFSYNSTRFNWCINFHVSKDFSLQIYYSYFKGKKMKDRFFATKHPIVSDMGYLLEIFKKRIKKF